MRRLENSLALGIQPTKDRESRGNGSDLPAAIQGGTVYKASIENRGDSRHYATTRHSSIVLDTKGQGANPVDTFLAGLCGCLGHYVRDYLDKEGLIQDGFSIGAEADVTPENNRIGVIQVCVDLHDAKLGPLQKSELLTYIANCKIHQILAEVPGISLTLVGQG